MDRNERTFALTISSAHGADHFLKRLYPPLLPVLSIVFGFPLWQLGLLLGARTFGGALFQAPMGVLADRYDRRYILPTGVGLVGLATLVFAASPVAGGFSVGLPGGDAFGGTFVVMFLAMLTVGIGDGTVHPSGYPTITANVREGAKGSVLGMWGSSAKFGDAFAPAFVGVLLLAMAWNDLLAIAGVVGVAYAVSLFVLLRRYDTSPADREPSEAAGAAVTDDSATTLDNRIYLYPMLAIFAYFSIQIMAANGLAVFLPQFITSTYGYSFTVLGVDLTPESTASFYYSGLLLVAGLSQLSTGWLSDRYDTRAIIVVYLVVAAIAVLALAATTPSPILLFFVLAVLGATLWGLNPARDALGSAITPAEREGRTFGFLWTGVLLASSASAPIIGYVGDVAGLRQTFALMAAVIVVSVVPVLLLLSDRVYLTTAPASDATGAD